MNKDEFKNDSNNDENVAKESKENPSYYEKDNKDVEDAASLFDRIPEDVMDEFKEELKEPQMGVFKRIVELFINPSEVMDDVLIKPYIWIMLVIITAVGLIAFLPTMGLLKESLIDLTLASNPQINDTAMIDSMMGIMVVSTIVGTIFGYIIAPLLRGIISHIVAILMGGEGKLKYVLGVSTMSYTAILLGQIIKIPLVLITGNFYASFSLAMFLGKNPTLNPYFGILSVFEIFSILSLYFYYIGIKKVHNLSTVKSIIVTLFPTILTVLFSFVPLLLMR